ncbi:uncharacterized protein LOC141912810 [Tubulanus polymorphus]|uniref:uncharacterized protein LOC141912810 n=1 Tax=Tubulanus polymorphus TaxID=672921 RepID=UPI003DA597D6
MPHGAIPYPFGDCKICKDKATGVHYGVATCEGCKGFFKRSIPKAEKYKCFFGGQCILSPKNRNRCKSCRFKQCVLMGMSVEAVKMGRIPKLEKERALQTEREKKESTSLSAPNDSGIDSNENSPMYVNLPSTTTNDSKPPVATTTAATPLPSIPAPAKKHPLSPIDVEMVAAAQVTAESPVSPTTPSRPNSSNSSEGRGWYTSVLSSPAVIKQLLNQVLEANSSNGQTEMINKLLHQVNNPAASNVLTSVSSAIPAPFQNQPVSKTQWQQQGGSRQYSHDRPPDVLSGPATKIPRYDQPVNIHVGNGHDAVGATSQRFHHQHQHQQLHIGNGNVYQQHQVNGKSSRPQYYAASVSGEAPPCVKIIKDEPGTNDAYCSGGGSGGGMNKLNEAYSNALESQQTNMSGWSLSQIDRYLTECVNDITASANPNPWQMTSASAQSLDNGGDPSADHASLSLRSNNNPSSIAITKEFYRDYGGVVGATGSDADVAVERRMFDDVESVATTDERETPVDAESKMASTATDEVVIPDIDGDPELVIEHLNRCFSTAVADYIEARQQLRQDIELGIHMDEANQLANVKSKRSEIASVYKELISAVTPCSVNISHFCRQIPGMTDLPADDQAELMKHGFFELWMIGASGCFYDDECHILLPSKKKYCMHWMVHFLSKELIKMMVDFSSTLNSYSLSDRELALISAIRATLPDREKLTSKDSVKKLHTKYLNLMTQEIIKKHPENGGLILSGLFMTLPQLATISHLQNEMIGSFQIDKLPEDATVDTDDDDT